MIKKRDAAADAEAALLEMAEDFRGTGLMTEDTYREITMRQLDKSEAVTAAPLTGDEIKPTARRASEPAPALTGLCHYTMKPLSWRHGTRDAASGLSIVIG